MDAPAGRRDQHRGNREYLIRRFIRPTGAPAKSSTLTSEDITGWENGSPPGRYLPARTPARREACSARILGDAAAHQPPLIPYNPALRPRNRGRRTGRRIDRSPPRKWVTPLQALLMAERAALLSGASDDFLLIVTIAYTGLRWGEAIGLERDARCTMSTSTSSGNSGKSTERSTGCRPRTTPTAAPTGNPASRSIYRPSSRNCSPHMNSRPRACACASIHGGSGSTSSKPQWRPRPRRSNYARGVPPAARWSRTCPDPDASAHLVVVDAPAWPAARVATDWPPADAQEGAVQPAARGRGIRARSPRRPGRRWLPIQPGLYRMACGTASRPG